MKLANCIFCPIRPTGHGGSGGRCISFSFFSRRLLSNGGQVTKSHFFSKKRRSVAETHEPSSPKVTCIGQVRVKSKRNGKKSRRKKKINGEVSFRKIEQSNSSASQECRNQRWVLLPISVCEALRGFGAEFSCLFPRKGSCFSRGKKRKNENGCGVVFPRWLVAVEEGGAGRRREIEVVVGGRDAAEETLERRPSIRSSRRHVFEDIEIKDDGIEEDVEEARLSICIPPKNALLLMRCRSDPMKMGMASISDHRFSWDANAVPRYENEEENLGEGSVYFREQGEEVDVFIQEEIKNEEESVTKSEEKELEQEQEQEEVESNMSSFEALLDPEKTLDYQEKGKVLNPGSRLSAEEKKEQEQEQEKTEASKTHQEDEKEEQEKTEESKTHQVGEKEEQKSVPETELEPINPINQEPKKENDSPLLPECLLLMMCEPKLSMEVSKETWVRGADFIRWLPERPRKAAKAAKTGGCDHELVKKKPNVESKPKPSIPPPPARRNEYQPPRSSCSLPAASVATVIEQKLMNGGGKEPFGLTRCKSEPMRTAAAKLMPESCGMKTEIHTHETVGAGAGAAGVGV